MRWVRHRQRGAEQARARGWRWSSVPLAGAVVIAGVAVASVAPVAGGAAPTTCSTDTFETDANSWTSWFAGTVDRSTLAAHSGTTSLRLTGATATAQRILAVDVCPAPVTSISFWVRTSAGAASAPLYARLVDQATEGSTLSGPYTVTDSWSQITVPVTTAFVNPTAIALEGYPATGTALFVDDVTLTTQTSPALPTVDGGGIVRWPATVASGVELHVRPFASLPNDSTGERLRLNVLATVNDRLFVGDENTARIHEITGGQTSLWFDLGAAVPAATGGRSVDVRTNWNAGLRSLAFHPAFSSNGKFYTSYMETRPASTAGHTYVSDVANPIGVDSVLVEWTANPQTMVVDPSSYREVFRVGVAVYEHTIKQISFNPFATPGSPDYGLLYVDHGDGRALGVGTAGAGNDALGKVLRIDPLARGSRPYTVPPGNPFATSSTMSHEAYAVGFRNPHHLAFSKDGTLIVVDAGHDNLDEVDIVLPGEDYGWAQREGTYVHLANGGILNGITRLPANDAAFGYRYPVVQYGHEGAPGAVAPGLALGGGYVVENGTSLQGRYFFTEFATTGMIYTAALADMKAVVTKGDPGTLNPLPLQSVAIFFDDDNDPATPDVPKTSMLDVVNDAPNYDGSGRADVRFGQGPQGELYLMSKRNGLIYLVTNSVPGSSRPSVPGANVSTPIARTIVPGATAPGRTRTTAPPAGAS